MPIDQQETRNLYPEQITGYKTAVFGYANLTQELKRPVLRTEACLHSIKSHNISLNDFEPRA